MPLKSSHTEQEDYHRHREAEPLSFTKLNPEASRSLTPKLHSLHKKVIRPGMSDCFPPDPHCPNSRAVLIPVLLNPYAPARSGSDHDAPLDAHIRPALWLRSRCPRCTMAHADVFRDDSHFARPISTRALALIMIPPLDAHTAPALWLRRRCPSCMARQKIRFDPSE